ncbi:response regulator [Halomicroarcula sp. GCM10025709]|uniref:response regulator n=1 Tax=Haloarcula TaxID=2237 RepID=UPI0024C26441|nr:response regulator [Halomicroarcula sp. YJ-61-S]
MTHQGKLTVLVVDDESAVADAYAETVDQRYEVEVAYSGAEALEKLSAAIDVVLLDRRMPDISGDEVLEEVRDRGIEARVAMVTAVDPDLDIIEMPFDDYIVKPVSPEALFETIERLYKCVDYEDQLREYYSLTAKYAALRSSKPVEELETSEEFEALESDMTEKRDELDDLTSSLDNRDFQKMFADIGSDREWLDNE